MYTKEEKEIAKAIVSNASFMALLKKVLIEPQQQWTGEVIDMSNELLGELVKADVMAQQKILQRFSHLQQLGMPTSESTAPVAPK